MRFSFPLIVFSVGVIFWAGCSTELDSRGAERLQFSLRTPPNVKTIYEVILGNREAKKYQEIHGPVKFILQRSYMMQKDESGNLLEPHFSGTVKIHYLPNGEVADFSSFDSSGTINTFAQVVHKANRREIYVHLFDADKDFVYFLANDNRIIEENSNPFYRQSPIDGSWNSSDGHLSWEENGKRQIVAVTGSSPSVQYRHLYEYDERDSLVRIVALNPEGKKIGSLERHFKDGVLQTVQFRFDERIFYPDLLNWTETYSYDAQGRLIRVITKHSKAWSPKNDTIRYVYRDSVNFSAKNTYRHGEWESSTVFDSLGNATFIETFGSFVYEGADGTAESYDAERIVREIHYYGEAGNGDSASISPINSRKVSWVSLSADEFFRSSPDSAYYCERDKNRIRCRELRHVPGTIFLNFVESVMYKNASEVYLKLNSGRASKPMLFSHGKCAAFIPESNELLFGNALVSFKRYPFEQFLGDTLSFSLNDFPCEAK